MRPDILHELLSELEQVLPGEDGKRLARQAFLRVANRNGLTCFDRDEQIAFIQHLRMIGERPSAIRARLMTKFGISRSTAYERIAEALQLSGKLPVFRTEGASNDSVESGQ